MRHSRKTRALLRAQRVHTLAEVRHHLQVERDRAAAPLHDGGRALRELSGLSLADGIVEALITPPRRMRRFGHSALVTDQEDPDA